MKGYLLDTNVISMLSPPRGGVRGAFLDWLERMDADGKVFLSVVTIHEIEKGIIAGIARAHDLVVVTGNARHFAPFDGAVSSPDEVVGSA